MKSKNVFYWGAAGGLLFLAFDALAQGIPSPSGGAGSGCTISATGEMTNGIMCQFQAAATKINRDLINPAIKTAAAAVLLQWILSYWKDLFKPDLSDMVLKMALMAMWFGGTVALIGNVDKMSAIFTEYLGLAGSLSSLSAAQFSPGAVVEKTMNAIGATNDAFSTATSPTGPQGLAVLLDIGDNIFAALMLIFANIFTFFSGLTVALSLFVATLEFWIMFAVAPLAFGLVPLSAFRDQGFAPIKGLLSLGLRVLILGVVVSVFNTLTDVVVAAMKSAKGAGASNQIMQAVWYYLAGMIGCAMMALSAGKIASAIASGSASFSGADAIKGGLQIATTAAAGAAVASAIPSALGSAAKSDVAGGAGSLLGRGVGSALNAFGPAPGVGGTELGVSPTSHVPGAPISVPFGAPITPEPPKNPAVGGGSSGGAGGAGRTPTSAPASGIGEGGERRGAPSAAPSSGGSADARPAAAPSAAGGSPLDSGEKAAGDASGAGIGGPITPPAVAGSPYKRRLTDSLVDAGQQNAADQHAVSVSLHVGRD